MGVSEADLCIAKSIWLEINSYHATTGQHSVRVGALTKMFIDHLDKSGVLSSFVKEKKQEIIIGAILHDYGKCKIPLEILNKTGDLNPRERALIQTHINEVDKAILRFLDPDLQKIVYAIMHGHHERFNGSGYPPTVYGYNIPEPAVIVSLCDVYEALTSTQRTYHLPLTHEEAQSLMRDKLIAGFHPKYFYDFMCFLDGNELCKILDKSYAKDGSIIMDELIWEYDKESTH